MSQEIREPDDKAGAPTFSTSTPYKAGKTDGVLRYLDESGRGMSDDSNPEYTLDPDMNSEETTHTTWCEKFADDVNGGEVHPILQGIAQIPEGREKRRIHARKLSLIHI